MAAKINLTDLRKKKPEELRKMLGELNKEHLKLRIQQGLKQLAKPSEIPAVRRNIARILTVIKQNEIKDGTS